MDCVAASLAIRVASERAGNVKKEGLRLRVNRTDGRTDEHVQHGKGALLYKELQPEAMAPREEFVGFWDTLTYIPSYPGRNLGTCGPKEYTYLPYS